MFCYVAQRREDVGSEFVWLLPRHGELIRAKHEESFGGGSSSALPRINHHNIHSLREQSQPLLESLHSDTCIGFVLLHAPHRLNNYNINT